MNIHKPTIHTEEETHVDIQANNTYRGRDTLRHTYQQDTYRGRDTYTYTSQQYIQRKRNIKTYIPTKHIQKEETHEHTQANNTHTEGEDA